LSVLDLTNLDDNGDKMMYSVLFRLTNNNEAPLNRCRFEFSVDFSEFYLWSLCTKKGISVTRVVENIYAKFKASI